jgi:DNA repair exonuclease SbcCD ATPase subunit
MRQVLPNAVTEDEMSPSPRILEGVLRESRRLQRSLEERLESIEELSAISDDLIEPVEGLAAAQAEAEFAQNAITTAAAALQVAEDRAATARQRQVAEQEERLSYGALAQLALRHLGEVCPVCRQAYDVESTKAHLAQLAADAGVSAQPDTSEVESLAQVLRVREGELNSVRARLRALQQRTAERNSVLKRAHAMAATLGVDFLGGDDLPGALTAAKSDAVVRLGDLRALRGLAESFSVQFSRIEEYKRLDDLRAQLRRVSEELRRGDSVIDLRDQAGGDAKQLHERTREISENLVASELKAIEPLLQRIYSSVDPHPSLRVVNLLTDMKRGRGQFWTSLTDTTRDVSVRDPQYVLSSSQLNVLAVVTFIALNLSIETLPLRVVALDDPLQSLDNVNLLGLADLLRRLRDTRQVIVSSHDERLAGLLQRKLRPVERGGRTSVISIAAWTPRGPSVSIRIMEPETHGLRLVNAAV